MATKKDSGWTCFELVLLSLYFCAGVFVVLHVARRWGWLASIACLLIMLVVFPYYWYGAIALIFRTVGSSRLTKDEIKEAITSDSNNEV
jgi:hypothetical protein